MVSSHNMHIFDKNFYIKQRLLQTMNLISALSIRYGSKSKLKITGTIHSSGCHITLKVPTLPHGGLFKSERAGTCLFKNILS